MPEAGTASRHPLSLDTKCLSEPIAFLENAVLVLPALWLYAGFIGDRGAAAMGSVWIVARIWYAIAYQKDPTKRGPGFGLSFLAFAGMAAGALWGVIKVLMA